MEVRFTEEHEAQLAQSAAHEGMAATQLVKIGALRLVEDDAKFRAALRRGISQADRGALIDPDDVAALMERLLRR